MFRTTKAAMPVAMLLFFQGAHATTSFELGLHPSVKNDLISNSSTDDPSGNYTKRGNNTFVRSDKEGWQITRPLGQGRLTLINTIPSTTLLVARGKCAKCHDSQNKCVVLGKPGRIKGRMCGLFRSRKCDKCWGIGKKYLDMSRYTIIFVKQENNTWSSANYPNMFTLTEKRADVKTVEAAADEKAEAAFVARMNIQQKDVIQASVTSFKLNLIGIKLRDAINPEGTYTKDKNGVFRCDKEGWTLLINILPDTDQISAAQLCHRNPFILSGLRHKLRNSQNKNADWMFGNFIRFTPPKEGDIWKSPFPELELLVD